MSKGHPTFSHPIGIFDSGVGGLAIYRAVRDLLPEEDLIYIADSGFAPYGDREAGYIEARVNALADSLVGLGAKALVMACNTATVVAVKKLRERHALPIIGVEPAIKPATAVTRSGKIVVLATQRTSESDSVARLCQLYGSQLDITIQPCPGLVEQIERGNLEGEVTAELLRRYIGAAIESEADTVVLGCTHYTFLESQIRSLVGREITIMESSHAVARQLARRLVDECNASAAGRLGDDAFFTTAAATEHASWVMSKLLGRNVAARNVRTLTVTSISNLVAGFEHPPDEDQANG